MLAGSFETQDKRLGPNRLNKWEIGRYDFGIFIALFFSSMVVFSSVFGKVAGWLLRQEGSDDPSMLVALTENLGMQLGMLFAYLLFKRISPPRVSPTETKHVIPSPLRSALIGLKWLLITYPIMVGVNLIARAILEWQGFEQVVQDPIRMVQEGGNLTERVFIFTMIVLVAPICEELVFRGVVFRYLHHRLPLILSVGLSGFFFAVIHFNLYSFAPLMVIGVTLALAYRESGSIVSSIALHSVFNTINLLLILFVPELPQ